MDFKRLPEAAATLLNVKRQKAAQGTMHEVQRRELLNSQTLVCTLFAPGRIAQAAAHNCLTLVPKCWPLLEASITPKHEECIQSS